MNFPHQMTAMIKSPWAKKVWISEVTNPNPNTCPNCGNAGHLYVTLASGGPFDSPAVGQGRISKSEIIKGKIKWWEVKSFNFPCPDCENARPT